MGELNLNRREFMQVGSTSLLALSTSDVNLSANNPNNNYEFQGVADLIGPKAARPAPNSDFFDNKKYYWYRYQTFGGEQYFISQDDAEWTNLSIMEKYEDAFGYPVVKGVRNTLDLPASYKFSEERYRYIENGTRIQDPEADSTRFTGNGKEFIITPQAGDTIEFKTAEAPRYIVGHDSAPSWAFQLGSDLVDANDSLTLFVEGSYELRFFGDGTAEGATIENGTDNVVRSFDYGPDLTVPLRPELVFNWYDVGRAQYSLDYTSDNEQLTEILTTLTDDTDWIADDPIGRIGFRLDVANSGIELDAGSMGYVTQSDVKPTTRPKPFSLHESELNEIPADGYGVMGAFRIDPDRDEVFTQLSEMAVFGEQNTDTEVMIKSVKPSLTDADFLDVDGDGVDEGPAYPRQMSPQNSVLQWTPNVSTFPTRTDAVTGNTIPAGRLLGTATEYSSGQGQGTSKTSNPFKKKRPIYSDDVALIIGSTPGTSSAQQASISGSSDQEW